MTRILVPGFVVQDVKNEWGEHRKVEVVSEEEWIQNSNQRYGEGLCCYVKTTTTITPDTSYYNMGLITKEQLEENVPIVEVEYKKWYLPHTHKDLYDRLIAVSEKNTTFVSSN